MYSRIRAGYLRELFDALPKKDSDILGECYGVFGYEKRPLDEIGMYHMMKESAVEKAKDRALQKLRAAYPGSMMQWWSKINRAMNHPALRLDNEKNRDEQVPDK